MRWVSQLLALVHLRTQRPCAPCAPKHRTQAPKYPSHPTSGAILSTVTSRFVRVLLVVLALAATVGLGYRIVEDEIEGARADDRFRELERAADTASTRSHDLRAALYAYVAAGQGADFWIPQAGALLEGLTNAVAELNDVAARASVTVDPPARDSLKTLAAAESRARRYVQSDQSRLASDVIFTEARDAIDAIAQQIATTRETAAANARAGHLMLQRQRAIAAGGALLIWLVVAILLVPTSHARAATVAEPASLAPSTPDLDLASMPVTRPPAEPVRPKPESLRPVPKVTHGPDMPAAAALCGDLARATSAEELSGLLERVARVLHASGVIVWMSDTYVLFPVASWGYDADVLARVGSIQVSAANLTAGAYRTGLLRTSGATGGSAAAVAAPLVGPSGSVGVLSGELTGVTDISENTAAVAAIFAAQLVTLVGAMPATDTSAQQANA